MLSVRLSGMRFTLTVAIAWLVWLQSTQSALAATPEVTAMKGMVVASSGAGAAEAGRDLLKRGGTAMDAAMTVAMLQPCRALGSFVSYGGIMALVYFDAATRKVYSLDAGFNTVRSEKSPLTIPGASPADILASARGGPASTPSGRTALVPGFFAGVEAAHKRFGRRRFEEIAAPAIRCAEKGFALTPSDAGTIRSRREVLSRLPATKAIFTKADGSLYEPGDLFKQPALAQTLRAVVKEGARAHIYKGAWAHAFVSAVQHDGGFMTMEDLAAYEPTWTEPIHAGFNGYEIYSLGLPVMAGLKMVEAMQSIERAGLVRAQPYDRDPSTLFTLLQIAKAMTAQNGRSASATQPQHTDAIVAVDERGNVAAVVHTINTVMWGSTGIFVNGVSIPDSASFQQQAIASIPPGSRLPATIHPGIALKDNKVALGFGSTGSGSGTRSLAALLSVLGHGMTPQQAIDAPALGSFVLVPGVPPELAMTVGEGDFSDAYLKTLEDLGQATTPSNVTRGYWLGVWIDPRTGLRRAGAMREFPQLAGGAAGY
jgi:gamma-glutamyltranspeptidase/glutathione hydrolase